MLLPTSIFMFSIFMLLSKSTFVYYCQKVFQTSNIERNKNKNKKEKEKETTRNLSCALSVLHMASSIDVKKQTLHLIFNQYEWERKRVLSFLAFSNAWTQQLLPLATKFLAQYLSVLHAWEISLLFFLLRTVTFYLL